MDDWADKFRAGMMSWIVLPYSDYDKPKKDFVKKWPAETLAIAATMATVIQSLEAGTKPEQLKHIGKGIRSEPLGILAITEHGCQKKSKPKAVRLYVFPDTATCILHVMLLGDKNGQSRDIALCIQTVKAIIAARSQTPATNTTPES